MDQDSEQDPDYLHVFNDDSNSDVEVIKGIAKKRHKEEAKEAIMLNHDINSIVNVSSYFCLSKLIIKCLLRSQNLDG